MTYRALLIGNSTFEGDASLNPLNAPTKDVARLHRALVDSDTGLFNDEHVRLVTERKHDEILDELDEFFASGRRDDLMLLYYSGHGILDEYSHLYLCGRDTRSDRLARTGISDETINNFIRGAASTRTVLVLDCCSSGMFKGGAIGTQLGGPGRYIVSSARGNTLANDSQSPNGTSLFTEHLVEGLLGGAKDSNGDGLIDLHEIYDYVKKRLAETSKQIPHSRFDGDGDISLARIKQPSPAIAIAADPVKARHAAEAPFGLSESAITLRDVDPDERLRPEIVEVCRFSDDDIDISAEALDDWLDVEVKGDRLAVTLRPREGNNRGKVIVRDRLSGSVQTLRVDAFVRSRAVKTAPAAEPRPAPTPPPSVKAAEAQPPRSAASAGSYSTYSAAAPSQPPTNQPYPPPTWRPAPQYGFQSSPFNQGGSPPGQYRQSGPAVPPLYQHPSPPAQPLPGQAPRPGTNGLAVASLVLSLVWIYGIGSLLAILFARSAKKQIAKTGQAGRGLATAGAVIGWIGLALLGLVIMIAIISAANSGTQAH